MFKSDANVRAKQTLLFRWNEIDLPVRCSIYSWIFAHFFFKYTADFFFKYMRMFPSLCTACSVEKVLEKGTEEVKIREWRNEQRTSMSFQYRYEITTLVGAQYWRKYGSWEECAWWAVYLKHKWLPSGKKGSLENHSLILTWCCVLKNRLSIDSETWKKKWKKNFKRCS